jgi:Acetoacetate decarboxylase (ADC)
MTTIKDLRGFCYPLTPGGVSSLVGDLPWHYATEYLNIVYRTDPAAIAAYLPEPLAPGTEPDLAYVAFSRWWSLCGTTSRTWRSPIQSAPSIGSVRSGLDVRSRAQRGRSVCRSG